MYRNSTISLYLYLQPIKFPNIFTGFIKGNPTYRHNPYYKAIRSRRQKYTHVLLMLYPY